MNITEFVLKKKALAWFSVALFTIAGIVSFYSVGRLEDPEFTIKSAVVVTPYPGASPSQVQEEVTDRVEVKLQELQELFEITSTSSKGVSQVKLDLKESIGSDELPQKWDLVRKKMKDLEPYLPAGAGSSIVMDDFGDVFGFLISFSSDGFSQAELYDYVKEAKRKLGLVDGVAKISYWGKQDEVIYVDIKQDKLNSLGISRENVLSVLQNQNAISDAGNIYLDSLRIPIYVGGEFSSVEDIKRTPIKTGIAKGVDIGKALSNDNSVVLLGDIADVYKYYKNPASNMMRFNGRPAIALALSNESGENIVAVGQRIDSALQEIEAELPVGIEVDKISWQSDLVDTAVSDFMVSLLQSVLIVLVVLTLSMGWRMGVIIGLDLIWTIIFSFAVMKFMGIDLHRMSFGALIIALGMMVDNAIVVAEGIYVRMQNGMEKTKAAIESAKLPAMPLLGATFIAVLTFYPIAASQESVGEYCIALFQVVAISLIISWFVSITITPLQCLSMLKVDKIEGGEGGFDTGFYGKFRKFLNYGIKFKYATLGVFVALLVFFFSLFGNVDKMFFPSSAREQFMVDVWFPEGTNIDYTSGQMEKLESYVINELGEDRGITAVSAFIGQGPARFYLPVEPEGQNPSYAQLILNVNSPDVIDGLMSDIKEWTGNNMSDALVPLKRYALGPANNFKFEYRIIGPADADEGVLRDFAQRGMDILRAEPLADTPRLNWRQPVQTIVADYNSDRAKWVDITRSDVASALKRSYEGSTIGVYRDGDEMLPIVGRAIEVERNDVYNMDVIPVKGALSATAVPLVQAVDDIEYKWENPILHRYNRFPSIIIQANPVASSSFPELKAKVEGQFAELAAELPEGYSVMWDGEAYDSAKSQKSLIPGGITALAMILFILVALFNSYRLPALIFSVIPFVFIGITFGMLLTGAPFGFVALLGTLSLAGMMIKNAIVLIDQINIELADGKSQHDAVVDATLSRLRPVMLAAGTTILGVIPLMADVFWMSMAVTIMFGLAVGTVVGMFLLPVLYFVFFPTKS